MRSESRTRLSLVLLLYYLGIVLVLTLAPFRFKGPPNVSHMLESGGAFDLVANVLLFLPLGFLYPLTRTKEETSPIHVFLVGLMLSSTIELTQAWEPERFTSLFDVATNAAGAGLGAIVLAAVTRRIRVNARLVGRLSLEIPLIGLIYLLVPLMLVASQSAIEDSSRLIALVPLGLLGARLMSAVQRYHFGPPRVFKDRAMGGFAVGWTVLGTFPLMLHHPLAGTGFAVAIGLVTWYESSIPSLDGGERRFEAETLRSAAPYAALYFIVVAVAPLVFTFGDWSMAIGLTGSGHDPTQQMLRLLEPVASLTLLGYMLAEARGRRERAYRTIAWRLALESTAVALFVEASRGFQRGVGASAGELALMIVAGLLGGAIYHKQRAHVRWILIHRPPTPLSVAAVPAPAAARLSVLSSPAAAARRLSRFSELSRP